MRDKPHINALPLGQKSWHVLATKTVAHTTDTADVELVVDVVDGEPKDAINLSRRVTRTPFSKIQSWTFAIIGGYSVASEQVRDDDSVVGASNGIGQAKGVSV